MVRGRANNWNSDAWSRFLLRSWGEARTLDSQHFGSFCLSLVKLDIFHISWLVFKNKLYFWHAGLSAPFNKSVLLGGTTEHYLFKLRYVGAALLTLLFVDLVVL